ncbi:MULTISPECIES: ferritin family protein [unclassified Fusibacter]|uniref:ferritin family protein n=1 Tax=unclassified Fusibacter TaxID=2624464 RepID=UPI0010110647|nr:MULTISPECIES: ferritin family protein [unclassified Fusibacter]MCK8058869.1 ferritin family protein [Fusibacter sp. A2]NPE21944.1 ferritin family protein [Fusibacter sp. A1]RXV61512.1 DUF2202 domain-containing protein [Fusibacter sp. A1]
MNQYELDTIKQAILNEIEGYEFYRLAAGKAHDEETRQALLNLSDEEMKHVEWLQGLFNHMRNEDADKFNLALVSDPPSPHIYDWNQLNEKDIQSTMSVFGIGMQMEALAIEFYAKAKEESKSEVAKKLYSKLIAWEQVHHDQFAAEYAKLKVEWWDEQRFSPF